MNDHRVPLTADQLAYVISHNHPGERYGRTVQRLIEAARLANLDPAPFTPVRVTEDWTPEEDALILDGAGDTTPGGRPVYTYTANELADMLNRTKPAIDTRRSRLRRETPV